MDIQLVGTNIEITPSLHDHVIAKISKLEHYFNNTQNAHVMLKVEHEQHIAEASIHLAGTIIHAKVSSTDMYVSIDKLRKKLQNQIVAHKEKLQHRDRHNDDEDA